jgi:hypothetical protein
MEDPLYNRIQEEDKCEEKHPSLGEDDDDEEKTQQGGTW